MSNVSHEGWVVHYLCSFLVIDCFAALYFSIAHLLKLDFFVSLEFVFIYIFKKKKIVNACEVWDNVFFILFCVYSEKSFK